MRIRYSSRKIALIDSLRTMQVAFGGAGSVVAIVMVLAAIVSIGWFGDAVYRLWFADMPAWMGTIPLILLLVLGTLVFQKLPELSPSIEEHFSRKAKGMVMFLSPTKLPEKNHTYSEKDIIGKNDSWEMPMKAIGQHWQRSSLECVVVIPSSDSSGREDGTWRLLERFRRFIGDAVGVPQEYVVNHSDHSHGVDFESAKELWESVGPAVDLLRKKGIADEDIVIDITGGQKMPAVMGGVAGLGQGLRLQYVSTRDGRILEYDITMQVER